VPSIFWSISLLFYPYSCRKYVTIQTHSFEPAIHITASAIDETEDLPLKLSSGGRRVWTV